jgi:hypothetical protein
MHGVPAANPHFLGQVFSTVDILTLLHMIYAAIRV